MEEILRTTKPRRWTPQGLLRFRAEVQGLEMLDML